MNQPGLIAHFRKTLEAMEGPSKNSPQIRAISTGLARLEAIITAEGELSEEEVSELRDVCREMLNEFYYTQPAGEAATAN